MKKTILITVCLLLWGCLSLLHAEETPDSPKNRLAAAKTYIQVVSVENILKDAIAMSVQDMFPDQKEKNVKDVLKNIRLPLIKEIIINNLVATFTADEINKLTQIHKSLGGLSIMNKFTDYANEVVPPIQEEIFRALSLASAASSRLFWTAPIQEFKTDITEDLVEARFTFKNQATTPITIKSVGTSCGCTTATLNKTKYLPGESGEIRAIFHVEDRVGKHSNLITVITDDPDEPMVVLKFRVEILDLLGISPRFIFWKANEDVFPKLIKLTFPKGRNVRIVDLESRSPCFKVKLIDKNIPDIKMVMATPKSTAQPCNSKILVSALFEGKKLRRFPIFLRILPEQKRSKVTSDASWDQVMWIDTRSKAEYDLSHLKGALWLNNESWDQSIEAVINQWLPGTQMVIYCREGCYSYQTAQRLREYGITDIYIIVSGQ